MSNVIWYIGVALISLVISTYIIYTKRREHKVSTLVVFYIFSSSTTWIGEFIVLGLFNSYAYKTGLFQNQWAQNLLGHLLLNASMFPAAALAMVVYSLRFRGVAVVTLIFIIVEYVFVKLGIYEHHWWRYYMSAINVVAFLIIAKIWFQKMNEKREGMTRAITFYFVAFLFIHVSSPVLLLLGKQHFQLTLVNNLFGDFYRSSIMVAFIHHLIITGIVVCFICILRKWYWKIAALCLPLIILPIYEKTNIVVMDDGWKLIHYIIIQQLFIATVILIEKYTLKPSQFKRY